MFRGLGRHPNIVMFMGISNDGERTYIVQEFVKDGSLFDLLQSDKALSIVAQLSYGFGFLWLMLG